MTCHGRRPKSRDHIDQPAADEPVPEPPTSFPVWDDNDIANEKWNVRYSFSFSGGQSFKINTA